MNEETFNWRMAMQLFSEGVELEIFFNDVWRNIDKGPSCVTFHSPFKYRRKPSPPPLPKTITLQERVADLERKMDQLMPTLR